MNQINFEEIETKELQCKGCTNKCSVLRFRFQNGNVSFAGNKCEKIFYNRKNARKKAYNAFEVKNKILFETSVQSNQEVHEQLNPQLNTAQNRQTDKLRIGIPRGLNMFENFPFWKTLFEGFGIEVVLSPESDVKMYQRGVGSVMSDNICFPAKLVQGHIFSLIYSNVDRIFYPIVPKEEKEFYKSNNSFNCPVVSGYPDVIRSAIDPQANYGIHYDSPVMNFANESVLKRQCYDYLKSIIKTDKSNKFTNLFTNKKIKNFDAIFEQANWTRKNYMRQFIDEQKNILNESILNGSLCFIVAGRPYHADLLVNQKVGQIISDLGVNVLTDDIFRMPESHGFEYLNLVSQWSYPNRVVKAAIEVAKLPKNVQLIQLNSFGCGPDSFFIDEICGILQHSGKSHTVLRIDEIASPGSIRLRCRSLIESLQTQMA